MLIVVENKLLLCSSRTNRHGAAERKLRYYWFAVKKFMLTTFLEHLNSSLNENHESIVLKQHMTCRFA